MDISGIHQVRSSPSNYSHSGLHEQAINTFLSSKSVTDALDTWIATGEQGDFGTLNFTINVPPRKLLRFSANLIVAFVFSNFAGPFKYIWPIKFVIDNKSVNAGQNMIEWPLKGIYPVGDSLLVEGQFEGPEKIEINSTIGRTKIEELRNALKNKVCKVQMIYRDMDLTGTEIGNDDESSISSMVSGKSATSVGIMGIGICVACFPIALTLYASR
jgi:hypothetical protein